MVTDGASSPPSGKRAERNRRAIVSAARDVFLRDGFDAGMDGIAAAAGVSKVTVYNHFRSKEELFTAVVSKALDETHAALAEARACLADATDVREALTRIARIIVTEANDPVRLALRNLITGELRRFPQLGHAWLQHGPGRFAAVVGETFGDLTERGRLSVADAELATLQFFGLVLYPHLIVHSLGATLPPDLANRLITDGVEMFLSCYQA